LYVGSSSQRARPSSLSDLPLSPGTREPPFICSQNPRTG
jgi:hypothetical protein